MDLKLKQFNLLQHRYKFISISTNRNINNKRISISPIKMNDKIAVLPIVIYNIEHFQTIEKIINEKIINEKIKNRIKRLKRK